jgi:hypothetical protein
MESLRSVASASQITPTLIRVRALAGIVGMTGTISLSKLLEALLAPVSFHANITTPSGTALGGTVDITLSNNGNFSFNVHMHDSGYDPYDFRVRCAVQSPGGLTLLFQTSGHTDGTGSDLLGSPNRDFNHNENGFNAQIKAFWLDVRASSMSVSKSYQDSGVLSTLEDVAKDLLGFLIADVTFGAGLALAVCVSADLANAFGASFVGPGGLVGVVTAGGVVWLFGPGAIIPAVIAGVAAGAITDALIKHRQLTDDEYNFAATVFGNTLPPRERIYVTNLSHDGGRKYTWPELDGSVIMNMDVAFDDPVHATSTGYPTQGQVFIHEMTHAWQIQTKSFIPGVLCKAAFETSSYVPGPPGQPWSDFGLEQQGAIVDTWFRNAAWGWTSHDDLVAKLASKSATTDPYFRYISENIRLGQD